MEVQNCSDEEVQYLKTVCNTKGIYELRVYLKFNMYDN